MRWEKRWWKWLSSSLLLADRKFFDKKQPNTKALLYMHLIPLYGAIFLGEVIIGACKWCFFFFPPKWFLPLLQQKKYLFVKEIITKLYWEALKYRRQTSKEKIKIKDSLAIRDLCLSFCLIRLHNNNSSRSTFMCFVRWKQLR